MSATIEDDRGRTVPFNAPNESGLADRASFKVHQQAWKSQPRSLAIVGLITFVGYIASSVAFRAALGRPLLTIDQIVSASVIGAMLLAAAAISIRKRTRLTTAFIAECRTHSVCASCGYSLQSLPAESDGCTLCPECGAAWRLARDSNDGTRREERA